MKNTSIIIAFSSMVLFSCGGSEGDAATETSKSDFKAKLSIPMIIENTLFSNKSVDF